MRRRTLLLLLLLLLAVGSYAARSLWLPSIAFFLIRAEDPVPAQGAVVLAGDGFGLRILRAAEIATAGTVPTVYVSGTLPYYDQNEADLSIDFAVKRGFKLELFEAVKSNADSTREEAAYLIQFFRNKGVKKFLVVTSNFHTRRTSRIFNALRQNEEIHIVAARTEGFDPKTWWTTRPSQKIVFMEWMKTIADWLRV